MLPYFVMTWVSNLAANFPAFTISRNAWFGNKTQILWPVERHWNCLFRRALKLPCRRALKVPCRRALNVPCRRALKVPWRRVLNAWCSISGQLLLFPVMGLYLSNCMFKCTLKVLRNHNCNRLYSVDNLVLATLLQCCQPSGGSMFLSFKGVLSWQDRNVKRFVFV